MKPTLYVTLLYSIVIQQFDLKISKHTPNQENYFSYHTGTTFVFYDTHPWDIKD